VFGSPFIKRRELAPPKNVPQETSFKLAIARDLERFSMVLEEPGPSSLQRLVERLERNTGRFSLPDPQMLTELRKPRNEVRSSCNASLRAAIHDLTV
jgi:hypothetical protein